jgi:cyclopropane fatty-acyl-phospholipid synthase-like methyltransferase
MVKKGRRLAFMSLIGDKEYIYPDRKESITSSIIMQTEQYRGYWQYSEEKIMELMLKHIKTGGNNRLLDAGCGNGRLLQVFAPFFNHIDAVEPDAQRFEICKSNLSIWNLVNKVNLCNCSIQDLEKMNYYDAIICSHVLQHINESEADKLIAVFKNMLKKNGLLFITTTHSTILRDKYCKSYLESGKKLVEQDIDQDEFNQIDNIDGLLPIKFYTHDSISSLLEKHRFIIKEYRVYHDNKGSRLMDKILGIDWWINKNIQLQQKRGRDLYVCAIPGCAEGS